MKVAQKRAWTAFRVSFEHYFCRFLFFESTQSSQLSVVNKGTTRTLSAVVVMLVVNTHKPSPSSPSAHLLISTAYVVCVDGWGGVARLGCVILAVRRKTHGSVWAGWDGGHELCGLRPGSGPVFGVKSCFVMEGRKEGRKVRRRKGQCEISPCLITFFLVHILPSITSSSFLLHLYITPLLLHFTYFTHITHIY